MGNTLLPPEFERERTLTIDGTELANPRPPTVARIAPSAQRRSAIGIRPFAGCGCGYSTPVQRVTILPTLCGSMPTVDSKGRVVLPKEVRERLGIGPGTEVEIREEEGKAVVEPEDDPERIIERMERLIENAAASRDPEPTPREEMHPLAQNHADAVRRGARREVMMSGDSGPYLFDVGISRWPTRARP